MRVQLVMGLRNILLVISCIIVGFCLSLYFQNDQIPSTVYWEEHNNSHYPIDKSRTQEELNKKILPYEMEVLIRDIYEKNRFTGEKTRIMEIGGSDGQILMEIRKRFPEVELYGIPRRQTHTFYRRENYITDALKFRIFTKKEIKDVDLPYLVFKDLDFGERIPYSEDKFDLIFTSGFIKNVRYKFELFNEIMRVLRPDGISIHTDMEGVQVYYQGVAIDLNDAWVELRKHGIDIKHLEDNKTIMFRKDKGHIFPVTPHRPIPENKNNISTEFKRPEMGYTLSF